MATLALELLRLDELEKAFHGKAIVDRDTAAGALLWQGIGAPKNTPPEIIERLNHEINAGLAAVNMKMRFAGLGGYAPYASSPGEFGKFIADEIEKWSMVIRGARIKPE